MSLDPDKLDERLRGAFERQLDETKARLHNQESPAYQATPTLLPTSARILSAAAVIAVVAGGYLLATSRSDTEPIDVGNDTTTSTVTAETTTSTTEAETTASTVTETDTSIGNAGTTVPTSVSSTGSTSSEPATTEPPTTSSVPRTSTLPEVPSYSPGVANTVCPTGRRAQLEQASLSYVGANQGWGRLNDLVDEQDGPYYYEAWEPGYADSVTVRVDLADPVLATEIRVAQDPFTPVSGVITIGAAGQTFELELEGVDGWKVETFQPTPLTSFTINRNAFESNIMEVIVCVTNGEG